MAHRIGSGNYPAGAEFDPNAPWNETVLREVDVEVVVTIALKKRLTITTNDYTPDEYGGVEEYNNLKEEVKNAIHVPDGWEFDEIEDIDY